MSWLTKLFVNAVIVVIAAYFLPGISVDGAGSALIVALVLSILNVLVKPLFIILTFPITILTLGLFLLFINPIMIELADALLDGFSTTSFLSTMILSLILSFFNARMKEKPNKKQEL